MEARHQLYSGEFDLQFGNAGIVRTDIEAATRWSHVAYDSVFQADGKLLATGDGGLTRYLDDGSIDPLFGVAGRVSVPFDARSMVLQADGKILVIGNAVDASAGDIGVARFLASGNLDTTFDQDGIAIVDFFKRFDEANDIAVQPDGRIVILGTSSSVVVMARLLANGALDTSFDGDGKKYFNATRGDSTLDRGTGTDDSQSILLVRYLANGILDATFGASGKLVYVSAVHRSASDVVLQPDGKILVSGSMQVTESRTKIKRIWSVSRLLANGLSDTSFGDNGAVSSQVIGMDGVATSLALQANGRIVVGGQVNGKPAVVRLSTDGSLDSSFGGDGRVPFDVSSGKTTVNRVRVLGDGKAIALGTYVDGSPTRIENDLFISRLRNDLEPAQSTLISVVDGGILVVDQWARDDALDIYREGANLVISDRTPDPRATLSVVGVRGSNYQSPKRVSIPWSTIQNTIHPLRFWLGLGDDNVQIMTQGDTGDVVPSAGLSIGMDGGNDTIALVDNTTVNNWYLNDANRVVMQLGNLGPVWVSGLDRIIGGDNVIDLYGSGVSAIIRGGAGNDRLYGGRGNDYIYGENGDDLIAGWEGNDQLFGGSGNDVLMGDSGMDFIDGGSGDDLMTGGFFSHLSYYAPASPRDSILSVWRNDTVAYSQRVTLLQTTGVGTNQQYKLIPVATARDDQSVDTLIGGSGFDWFFAKGSGPGKETDLLQAGVRDRLSSEKLDLL